MIKRQCCKCVEAFVPSTWYIYFIIHENLVEKIKYKSSTKKTFTVAARFTLKLWKVYMKRLMLRRKQISHKFCSSNISRIT